MMAYFICTTNKITHFHDSLVGNNGQIQPDWPSIPCAATSSTQNFLLACQQPVHVATCKLCHSGLEKSAIVTTIFFTCVIIYATAVPSYGTTYAKKKGIIFVHLDGTTEA